MDEQQQGENSQDWITRRGARGLIALFLVVKLVVTIWNGSIFDGQSYDTIRHAQRAASGGLTLDELSYDPPLYYLPALAFRAFTREEWNSAAQRPAEATSSKQRDAKRTRHKGVSPYLGFLRATNVVYVGAFYLMWIYGVLPLAIPDWRRRFLAALLLLALPGYQKLAVMPHPDNLHLAMATLTTFAWLRLAGRRPNGDASEGPTTFVANLKLAALTGLTGLTRPFAAATVATFAAANVVHLWLSRRAGLAVFCRQAALVMALTAGIAGSWFVGRGLVSGTWRETYPEGYLEQFDRRGFDYVHYLTTFHLRELLAVPNRGITRLDAANWARNRYVPENRYANSFFTTLYSETWGDHWLFFSGAMGAEGKAFAKRAILVFALPLIPLLLLRFAAALRDLLRGAAERGLAVAVVPPTVLLVHLVAGATLFLWWQLGSALSPGKQSSIKFIYNAYLYAPAITLCFTSTLRPERFNAWFAYLLMLFVVALPVAVFVPGRW